MGANIFILVRENIVYVIHMVDYLLIKYGVWVRGILVVLQLIYRVVEVYLLIPGQLVFLVVWIWHLQQNI